MNPASDLDAAAELLRVIGHAVRLRLLAALSEDERAVGDLEALTGTGQPALSQQLGILRKAGLVRTRRAAKQVFYRLDRERVRDMAALLHGFAGASAQSTAQKDARRRFESGGSAAMFARIG